ncbi:MAG: DsrE family protein [Aquificaceae bacterium]|nr:DsrE family protein [Aquificaceae bacterium]MCS7196430.1 DsrE family protein [Aquificaceae bacterium]MCX8076969.1 DsrE family protein [Aquificaceae bacterium]MDW8032550.1 DsrE family protein [Aquificaceae bacterium]MDW8294229.1 DsrE family protein [Aquificaceae bacterium]
MKVILGLFLILSLLYAQPHGKVVQTPYQKPFKVVYELFLDHPEKLRPALGWISNLFFVLTNPPYNFSPDDLEVVVVSHGRELPVFVAKNRKEYGDIVERLESLSLYGVRFKVCRMAAEQVYGFSERDFYPFVELVPSAIVEIIHWQLQGYALMVPQVFEIRR